MKNKSDRSHSLTPITRCVSSTQPLDGHATQQPQTDVLQARPAHGVKASGFFLSSFDSCLFLLDMFRDSEWSINYPYMYKYQDINNSTARHRRIFMVIMITNLFGLLFDFWKFSFAKKHLPEKYYKLLCVSTVVKNHWLERTWTSPLRLRRVKRHVDGYCRVSGGGVIAHVNSAFKNHLILPFKIILLYSLKSNHFHTQ